MKTASAALLLVLVTVADGLYFHIKQGEVKCFVEEVPDETMVSGEFDVVCRSSITTSRGFVLVETEKWRLGVCAMLRGVRARLFS
jgi:hypothetical protein